ncbi:hypothetical protein P3342_012112 [Pyrenophora teres f. teres]|nr:hypothetical protein P3342_012112 [Pyrenophora teres f. teres]
MRLTTLLPAVLIGLTSAAAMPATPVQDAKLLPNGVLDARDPQGGSGDYCCPSGLQEWVYYSCPQKNPSCGDACAANGVPKCGLR